MNVCFFCSARDLDVRYTEPSTRLVKLLAELNDTLVWGGSNIGLMKVVADTAHDEGMPMIGITCEMLKGSLREHITESIICKDLSERKATMEKRSDAFIVLPGGTGTLDEITEILELKKHNIHAKPIVLFSIEGFYDGLHMQMKRMEAENFFPRPLAELVSFASTPEEVLSLIG